MGFVPLVNSFSLCVPCFAPLIGAFFMARFAEFYSTRAWRRLSVWRRKESPLCALCLQIGVYTEGTQADHIVPLAVDWDKRLDPDNTQSLCLSCHSGVKARQEISGRIAGNDEAGEPLDKSDSWWSR